MSVGEPGFLHPGNSPKDNFIMVSGTTVLFSIQKIQNILKEILWPGKIFVCIFQVGGKYILCECERKKRPQLFVALGEIGQPAASHSQAVQSAKRLNWGGGESEMISSP